MLLNFKLKFIVVITVAFVFLMGHAPWGQMHVYRQLHMLIMCSKTDNGAYNFTKNTVKLFDEYLPDAKARVARAKNVERVVDLLKTEQIPLAIFSLNLLNELVNNNKEYSEYFTKNTKIIFVFKNMVLLSTSIFPSDKVEMIHEALLVGSKKKEFNSMQFSTKNKLLIPFHEGVQKSLQN